MLTHINWLLKSRNRFPSGVQNQQPFAPATGIGSTAPCADHSNSVCFRVRSTIVWPSRPVCVVLTVMCAPDAGLRLLAHGPFSHSGRREASVGREPAAVRK